MSDSNGVTRVWFPVSGNPWLRVLGTLERGQQRIVEQ